MKYELILINWIWTIAQILVGYNLVLPLILLVIYTLINKKKFHAFDHICEADYAIIVTAYEQTDTLHAVVSSLLKLNYSSYLIYIVADKCNADSLKFDEEKVILLRPEETLASNTRSHFYAINRFKRQHDRLTIIDSDNLVEPDYLLQLNKWFEQGYVAVQGVRKAKNINTTYAALDAARDMYYHFYDGEVLFQIGSSATLAGSGMAFTVQLYKNCLEHADVTGAGFDKVLQAAIVNKGLRIAFAKNAIVYDEKTSRSDQLVKQRARWINTWFKYFKFGFELAGKGIIRFNRNQFLFGTILLRPPLFMFLLLSVFFLLVNIFIGSWISCIIWIMGFILFVTGFFIALKHAKADNQVYRSLRNIPVFIFYQVLSLLKITKANKYSVATKHYYNNKIEEMNN